MPGPLLQLLKETIEKERLNTLELISKPVIEEQSRKGRITKEEILLLLEAVDRYLQDVCNFAFDGLPVYFREVLPGVKQSAYRQDYKYAFETVMSNSREDLFDRIRKNSTIQRLRHYL